MNSIIEKKWQKLWNKIYAIGDSEIVFSDLVARYSESQRAYHTIDHIQHCLCEFSKIESGLINPQEVELAIWYHDAIYDTTTKDNEEKSAKLFVEMARFISLHDGMIKPVERLIMITKHDKPPKSYDERIIIDVDLSILGQPYDSYDRYAMQIQKEYDWMPKDQFNAGRAQVLNKFLERPWIYSTAYFKNLYETNARNNIQRELDTLV